jgi:hypothetical protein
MAESLRWRELQDGGMSNMAVCLNMAEYLNVTKARHFKERGGRVVRQWTQNRKILGSNTAYPTIPFFKD